jgi:hypothetical protein
MVKTGGEGTDDLERLAAGSDERKASWKQTLEETQALADQRRSNGREAVVVPAGDAGLQTVDDGDGLELVFVIPGNKAEDVTRLVESNPLEAYDVYRRTVGEQVFLAAEYFDPDAASLFIAGAYKLQDAGNAVTAANDGATFQTMLRKLDGTPVATFNHADRTKFLPTDRLPVDE